MAAPRKKWATQPPLMKVARRNHPSKPAAYRDVQEWAAEFAAGTLRQGIREIEVYVDEGLGRGWELYETINLAGLAPKEN